MKYIAFAFSALTLSLFVCGSAKSYDISQEVVVADQMIHPIRVGAGGYSAEQRVARVNERLIDIIAKEPLYPANIRLRMTGDDPSICAGRHLIATVTDADADANHLTKMELAHIWLRRYRMILPNARPDMNRSVRDRDRDYDRHRDR